MSLTRLCLGSLGLTLVAIIVGGGCSDPSVTTNTPDTNDGGADAATNTAVDGGPDTAPVPVVGAPVEWKSGSRLRAYRLEPKDQLGGGLAFAWYDNVTKANCFFLPAADGELRCIPSAFGGRVREIAYGDADCKQPVAGETTSRDIVYLEAPESCARGADAYKVGGAFTPSGPVYVRTGANGCALYQPSADSRVLTKVAPTEFVRGTKSVVARGAGVSVRTIEADDGAVQIVGLRNDKRDESCSFVQGADGVAHCAPLAGYVTRDFADEGCKTRAVSLTECWPANRGAKPGLYP